VKSGPTFPRSSLPADLHHPHTFPSYKIGALMILWMDSPEVIAVRTPSNTVACRTPKNCC